MTAIILLILGGPARAFRGSGEFRVPSRFPRIRIVGEDSTKPPPIAARFCFGGGRQSLLGLSMHRDPVVECDACCLERLPGNGR
jgi:hypothetical protein